MNDKIKQEWRDTFAVLEKELPKGAFKYLKEQALKDIPELEGVI